MLKRNKKKDLDNGFGSRELFNEIQREREEIQTELNIVMSSFKDMQSRLDQYINRVENVVKYIRNNNGKGSDKCFSDK